MTDFTKNNIKVSKEYQEALSGVDNFSFGDEVLAAHDAVTCPTASNQADKIGQVLK